MKLTLKGIVKGARGRGDLVELVSDLIHVFLARRFRFASYYDDCLAFPHKVAVHYFCTPQKVEHLSLYFDEEKGLHIHAYWLNSQVCHSEEMQAYIVKIC